MAKQERKETATGDETGQRALLECSMQEDINEEWSPPERLHALYACSQQGGEVGGGVLIRQSGPMARSQ